MYETIFLAEFVWKLPSFHQALLHAFRKIYKGNGSKLLIFCVFNVVYDWPTVALNTIVQSKLTLVHPKEPRNHVAYSLYPFSVEFLKMGKKRWR